MKETEIHLKDKTAVHAEQVQEKKINYLESIKHYPGHIIWEFNLLTCTLTHAEIKPEPIAAPLNKKQEITTVLRSIVVTKEGCIYTSAINEKNALRKLGNIINCKITINRKK